MDEFQPWGSIEQRMREYRNKVFDFGSVGLQKYAEHFENLTGHVFTYELIPQVHGATYSAKNESNGTSNQTREWFDSGHGISP